MLFGKMKKSKMIALSGAVALMAQMAMPMQVNAATAPPLYGNMGGKDIRGSRGKEKFIIDNILNIIMILILKKLVS